ncbi:GSCFA domain-containing protein [Methylopila sp. 73B]|uniref:GSCFA domain-containing protein n=1 Tax=Methylopila sp. 73B TaxID=1120792 RepID=UPI00035E648B|nr:GSCFA domain-containing protein [Methylopila sp. 73B]
MAKEPNSAGRVSGFVEGREVRVGKSYNRGADATFGPSAVRLRGPQGLQRYLLNGLMPSERFIGADTTIVAFGSCFANNISNYLNDLGFNVATKRDTIAYISKMGDGMVNTFAIRQQFEWAWNNVVPKADLWRGYNAEEFGYDEAVRLKTAELFDAADVFIITLGLSEIWYDEVTGEVFWRTPPDDKLDPTRHKFRLAEFDESYENLKAIHSLIRERKPEAHIVFTVSPIALAATFRAIPCIVANTESKAILRAALGKMLRERQADDDKLFYFPSYEIVTEAFRHQFGADRRHLHSHVLDLNMKAFERYFCKTELDDARLSKVYTAAITLDKELGGDTASIKLKEMREAKATKRAALIARKKSGADKSDRFTRVKTKTSTKAERIASREARIAKRASAAQP